MHGKYTGGQRFDQIITVRTLTILDIILVESFAILDMQNTI